jgi:hypothetical protein
VACYYRSSSVGNCYWADEITAAGAGTRRKLKPPVHHQKVEKKRAGEPAKAQRASGVVLASVAGTCRGIRGHAGPTCPPLSLLSRCSPVFGRWWHNPDAGRRSRRQSTTGVKPTTSCKQDTEYQYYFSLSGARVFNTTHVRTVRSIKKK